MFTADRYNYSTNNTHLDYEFDSIGNKGVIKKVARFTWIEEFKLYSFWFGDFE